jgi:hypothetical protein
MLPRNRMYYYNGKKYYMPKHHLDTFFPILEPTTGLQSTILFHICVTKNANYKSVMDATKRNRITILQSLRILIERHLIYQEKINPHYKKSKLIFKATDRGIFNVIGNSDSWETCSIVNQIENAHMIPSILRQFKELTNNKGNKSSNSSSLLEPIKEFAFYMSANDLFDKNGFSLVNEIRDLWKHEVRMWMSEIVSNKYFDIENLFGSQIRHKFENFLIPPYVPGFKETLIKIRNNLDECINQLSN